MASEVTRPLNRERAAVEAGAKPAAAPAPDPKADLQARLSALKKKLVAGAALSCGALWALVL